MSALWKKETQQDMEYWFQRCLSQDSYILKKGIIKRMNPTFVSCNYEQKTLTLEFVVQNWQINPEGILHGGIFVTAFDTAFGMLCHYYAKQNMINTIEISTTFLKPVPENCKYQITVTANHVGKTITSMTAKAVSETNILLATASSSFIRLQEKFVDIMP